MGSKAATPPTPDYEGLAEKTAASQHEQLDTQIKANRPNQTDAYGNTSTWTQGADGSWSQQTNLNPAAAGMVGQTQEAQARLMAEQLRMPGVDLGAAQNFTHMDPNQLQQTMDPADLNAGQFNWDPKGNSQEIQDATYGLLAPQREQARSAEIQRLKNQGLSEDSPAFQRAMLTLGQGDTDAQLKSLIAGQSEYGNQFARASSQNQQNFGQSEAAQKLAMQLRGEQVDQQEQYGRYNMDLRDRQLAEQDYMRQMPAQDLETIMKMQQYQQPQFANFMTAGQGAGTDYSSAAQAAYDSNLGAANAKNAARANNISSGVQLAGTAAAMVMF